MYKIWILFLFLSCQQTNFIETKIEKDKFIEILTEMYLKEGALQYGNYKIKDSLSQVYNKQIFESHNVEDSIFYSDFEYYNRNPSEFDSILITVAKNCEAIKTNNKNDKSK